MRALLEEARRHPDAVISGEAIYDSSVPRSRRYGRYLTHVWVWINTLSFDIRDSMCGLRVYPLAATCAIWRAHRIGQRMDFDTEIMVRLQLERSAASSRCPRASPIRATAFRISGC